jgi:membrane-bound ClpP family serine protease
MLFNSTYGKFILAYEMKRSIRDWFIVLVSLLDDLAIVLLVLLVLRFLKISISLPIIIFLILFFIATVFIMHRLVIPALHKKIKTGSEGMIGLKGEVTELLAPKGVVRVNDEYWKARSSAETIEVGEQVEIVGVNRLTLQVKRKTQ